MKTKKCGVYAALAVVLLISAVLVTNCVDPTNFGGITATGNGNPSFVPPPGKAYIHVTIPKEAGRSIIPDAPTGPLYYKVDITNGGASTFDNDDAVGDGDFDNATNTEIFIVLASTSYDITIGAYTSDTFAGSPVAMGEATVLIDAQGNGSVTIPVLPIVNGTTTGTFNYHITLPSGTVPDTATLSIISYTTPGLNLAAQSDLKTLSISTQSLPSDYYWVRVTMVKAKYESVTYSHILHIYGNQISTWGTSAVGESITLANLNKNSYDVTYNLNYAGAVYPDLTTNPHVDDNGGTGWPNGQFITAVDFNGAAAGTDPERTGFDFDGWHKVASSQTSLTEWIFATTPIYKDTTLYAKWDAGLRITITPYSHPEDPDWEFDPPVLSYTHAQAVGLTGLNAISVEATLDSAFSYPEWWYGDTSVPSNLVIASDTLTSAAIDTFNTPTKRIDFAVAGDKVFTFKAMKGAVPYSTTFTINIQAPL